MRQDAGCPQSPVALSQYGHRSIAPVPDVRRLARRLRQEKTQVAGACGAQRGVTLVELVSVIVILGILSAVAAPRFISSDAFRSRGFYDQATATVRYAQKIAIAQRRPVFVCVNAPAVGDISVSYVAGCATQISDSTGVPLKVSAPSGVTLAPTTNFSFLSGKFQPICQR